jgi:hypothetical protein
MEGFWDGQSPCTATHPSSRQALLHLITPLGPPQLQCAPAPSTALRQGPPSQLGARGPPLHQGVHVEAMHARSRAPTKSPPQPHPPVEMPTGRRKVAEQGQLARGGQRVPVSRHRRWREVLIAPPQAHAQRHSRSAPLAAGGIAWWHRGGSRLEAGRGCIGCTPRSNQKCTRSALLVFWCFGGVQKCTQSAHNPAPHAPPRHTTPLQNLHSIGFDSRPPAHQLLQALLFPLEVQEGGDAARDQQVVQRLRFGFKGRGFRGP